LEADLLAQMPDFRRRMHWFLQNRPHLSDNIVCRVNDDTGREWRIVGIVTRERLKRILRIMLDEKEFLSPYGIRSLSKVHQTPYQVQVNGDIFRIAYEPGESQSGLFGGNSNWRGPIWFPINYLLIEALHKHHRYYGNDFKVEFPTGSGHWLNLGEVAAELSERLTRLFLRNEAGQRPFATHIPPFQHDPHWRNLLLFHEYFHGDHGAGLGASHQTGWTGLVAGLIQQQAHHDE
jgi:hypothetical protein